MTSRRDFTGQEWTRIRRVPLVVGVAILLADPGGPIEVAKETMATLRSATLPLARRSCWRRWPWMSRRWRSKEEPGGFQADQGQQVLEELREVNELVTEGHTPGG